jgi:hypothetical protein
MRSSTWLTASRGLLPLKAGKYIQVVDEGEGVRLADLILQSIQQAKHKL